MNSESFKNICLGLGAVAVPIVAAILGNQIKTSVQEKDMQGRFVEMAVGILQNQDSATTPALRDWAVSVIDGFSGVPLGDEASNELVKEGFPDFAFSGTADTWQELREEDRDQLWGDDHIWSCYVVTGEKVTCFPWSKACVAESKKAKERGENIVRPCGEILYSSDAW